MTVDNSIGCDTDFVFPVHHNQCHALIGNYLLTEMDTIVAAAENIGIQDDITIYEGKDVVYHGESTDRYLLNFRAKYFSLVITDKCLLEGFWEEVIRINKSI